MLPKTEIADLLTRVAAVWRPGPAGRQAVAEAVRDASFDAGQIIFSRGDAGTELYVVSQGPGSLSVLTADGQELSFAHAEAPSVFGELAVFDGRPRSADATAVGKVEALSLSKSAFAAPARDHAGTCRGGNQVSICPPEGRRRTT